jgi:Fe-S cluster biogenesis protein NfuA
MRVLSFEPTPNPNAMKFLVDGRLIEGGSRAFESSERAAEDPLASSLFALGKVNTVFFMPGFVTVNKEDGADWGALAPAVARVIETATESQANASHTTGSAPSGDATLDKINQIIDEQIRPALAMDGGGLEIIGLEGQNLQIRYQGACGSCPSSIQGTLQAIQNLLQAEVDERLTVTAA